MSRPIARTGIPARTQFLSSYDPGTRTYVGNKSRFVHTKEIGSSQTFLSVECIFYVTPLVGDNYQIPFYREYVVTPGVPKQIIIEYPWIVGASVYMGNPRYSIYPGAVEDFESFQVGQYQHLLSASDTWDSLAYLEALPPNTECYDDFELYAQDPTQLLQLLLYGYGWVTAGETSLVDSEQCYDDFESYAAGDIFSVNAGFGWLHPGSVYIPFEYTSDDDFESYAAGTLATFNYYGGYWAADGIAA